MDLLPNNFIKINKALIVNKDHIIQIDGCMYEMDNHEILWGAIRIASYHRRINKKMKGIKFIKK